MEFVRGSSFSILGFIAILVAICSAFIAGVGVASERLEFSVNREMIKVSMLATLWLGVFTFMSIKGWSIFGVPLGPVFLVIALAIALFVSMSSYGARLALGLTVNVLVAFQVVRFPMELVLHQWAKQGTIPTAVTWSGHNWDVLTGLMALVVVPIASRYRGMVWLFNVFGMILFINLLLVWLATALDLSKESGQPALRLAYHIPYFLIFPIYFAGIFAGHIVLTRALVARSK